MKPLEAIRCTQQSCSCECFSPGKVCLRYCDSCNHGWVAHALDKLGYQHAYNLGMQVEVVQPNIVFDIASLMLYGAQATPVRLKILLDRLFSVLQHEEVLQVLHGFGWSYEDYARGYILQDSSGRVLDKWSMATRDEEHVILQQFLRFGETKAIAQEIILQDTRDKQDAYSKQTSRAESEIKKFIERSNLSMQSFMKLDPARQMFAGRLPFVPGARILTSPILTPTPYSPSRDNTARPLSLTTSPAASSTPLSTPPISRLQAYEFRRDLASSASPAPSPSSSEKVSLSMPTNTGMTVPTVVATMAAAGHRSPVTESPQNLSTTPSSVQSAPSPCVTPQKTQPQESGDMSAGYAEDSEDDQSMGAIDYSTKDSASSPSTVDQSKAAAAAAAARHLRKSNNPIKRQWIPSANFGNSFIGPNGKKRVLCTACNKTFCDKGALKIHYSAVHLKEMHKCTVEGCNMMFSSRRSRNRHSANPNPKLHMPQKRKELEGLEDDDPKVVTSMPTSLGTSLSTSLSSSPNMVVAPALVAAQRTLDAGSLLRADPAYFMELGAPFPFSTPPEKRIKLENQDTPTDLSSSSSDKGKTSDEEKGDPEKASTVNPQSQTDADDDQQEVETVDVEVDVATDGDDGTKGDVNGQRGGNRRKSNAPTRCAKNEEAMVVSDDNSDDKEAQQQVQLPGLLPVSVALLPAVPLPPASVVGVAVQAGSTEGMDVVGGQPQDLPPSAEVAAPEASSVREDKGAGAANFPQIASLLLSAKEQREKDDDSSENELIINGDAEDEDEEGEEKEDADVEAAANNDNDHNHNNVSREEGGEEEDESCGSVPSPSSDTAEGMVMLDPGSEVYLAKDNCRKCALCGKIFQNQFSVKIHFQNVHLKLMHGCTVDGCSAAFPSKRSRDRHSSNLNLHRKMMSGGDSGLDSSADPTLREDILTTLYGANQLAAAGALSLHCNGQTDGDNVGIPSAAPQEVPIPLIARSSSSAASQASGEVHSGEEEDVRGTEKPDENAEPLPSSNGPTKAEEAGTQQVTEVREPEPENSAAAATTERAQVRRDEPVCMSRKPVCCGMTFHTESALKEHYALSHPSQTLPSQTLQVQPLKPRHTAATETLLSSRRPRHRPKHKNGLHRLVSTGRKNGFS